MRGFVVAVPLALLTATAVFAQAPVQPAPPKPAGQAPAQPAPKPAGPPPAQAPPATAQPAPAPRPPAPFPQGAKFAFVNLQGIFQLSGDGKTAAAKVQSIATQKQAQIAEKQKTLAASQQKLQTGGSLMNETARGQLEKDIDRQTRELERFQQDAQAELNELQQELNDAFQKKLFPVLEKLAQDKALQMLFSSTDAGLIWAEPGLDLTEEAAKRLDATPTPK
jgi:Skp family chaperone for outer membrane proteins